MRSPTLLSASSVPASLKPVDQRAALAAPLVRYVVFGSIALLACATDLLTKQWIFAWRGFPQANNIYWLIEPYVGIETSLNPGALFGMGAGYSFVFATLSVVAMVGIIAWLVWGRAIEDRWMTVALGLVMGGIFDNLYDRLGLWHYDGVPDAWRNNVRDWILLQYNGYVWPNFNIADSCLVVGAAILVIHAVLNPAPDIKKAGTGDAKSA